MNKNEDLNTGKNPDDPEDDFEDMSTHGSISSEDLAANPEMMEALKRAIAEA